MSLERAAQRRGIVHQDGYSNEHHQAELIDAGRKHQERVYKLTQMGKAFVDFILDERLVTSKGESPAPGAAGGSRDGQAGGAPFE